MISKNRIENCVKCLKTLESITTRNNYYISGKELKEVCKQYKMSRDILTRAIDLNYVKRIDKSKYKFMLLDIQPIHGRKLIEYSIKLIKNSKNKNKVNEKQITENFNKVDLSNLPNLSAIPKIKSTVKKEIKFKNKGERKISILWGLFSWTKKN